MEKIKNGYKLASGREFFALNGLISIARYPDRTFRICQGYDGRIEGATEDCYDYDDEHEMWTAQERCELADFMIAQWTAYRERHS